MKKRVLLPLAALLCLALLAGCRIVTGLDFDFDADSISKAQRIVVNDAAGNEKAVLTEQGDIDALVAAMNVDGWRLAELPGDLTEAGSLTLWQQETITALMGEREARVNEICTFHVYQEGDYLTIETGLIDIHFSVPARTASYLRGLAA